jgi:hypothetical protein
MGLQNSSRTRVAPVFNRLLERDRAGTSWLPRLLELPQHGSAQTAPPTVSGLTRHGWWPNEVQLPAPAGLLAWLLENLPHVEAAAGKRAQLVAGDPATLAEARELLARRSTTSTGRAWFVLEGPTSVDAYFETPELILLVEGKRTERGPTTHTTYMAVRHQILRNLDAAWNIRGERAVVAMFIVEGRGDEDEVPKDWQEFAIASTSVDALAGSLPHRAAEERAAIGDGFLGVTTWQIVCRAFGLPFPPVSDEIGG